MPTALVAPGSPATYWLAINIGMGLVETKEENLMWWGAQTFLSIYSPYRNMDINCFGSLATTYGTFDTSYGVMTFQDARATCDTPDNGRLQFVHEGNTLIGYWIEDSSVEECESSKDSSKYWGRMEFVFDESGSSFKGSWGYCDDEEFYGLWSGTRR